ncbi:hypothetical protein [Vibrio alginolyticus]|uniref:hypothetical protein n=1 Tax=Vibrio alginolyticus TaxID=663 RepID=UPI001BD5B39A|nr:hypothetical protein [Vibrio alginolyticus]MBT0082723.1 hypothetical protein [Vibrio alginolyticus]MBT0105889.1 hypothetical protein [Vibrio alginolyticus]
MGWCTSKGGSNMVGHSGGQQRYPVASSANRKPKYSVQVNEDARQAGESLKEEVQRQVQERQAALRALAPELYDEIDAHNKRSWEVNSRLTAEEKVNGMLEYRDFESEYKSKKSANLL